MNILKTISIESIKTVASVCLFTREKTLHVSAIVWFRQI